MDSETEVIIVVVLAVGAAGAVFLQRHNQEVNAKYNAFLALPWAIVGIITIASIVAVFVFWQGSRLYKDYSWRRNVADEQRKQYIRKIEELLTDDFKGCSSGQVTGHYGEIKARITEICKKEHLNYDDQIAQLKAKIPGIIQQKKVSEEAEAKRIQDEKEQHQKQEALKRNIEAQKQKEFDTQVHELLAFKLKERDPDAKPVSKKYPEGVNCAASSLAEAELEKRQFEGEKQQEATEYYQNHSLESIPQLSPDEEEVYAEVRSRIKNGSLRIKKSAGAYKDGGQLDESFYRAPELTREEKIRAQNQSFEYVRLNELDGHVSGGFYIKRPDNETAYHFCMKQLFAELHDNMQIEYFVAGREVDLALTIEDFRLGIEIETGLNKTEDVQSKIPWLNQHFDQWMFVVKKELLPKYSQFVDNKRSFCFTSKEAMEHVMKICTHH